jgi:CRP-like cAMP-binding protein
MFERIRQFVYRLVQPTEPEWQAFVSLLRPVSLERKELYLREGDVCRKVGFINQGCARMYLLVEGREICKDFLFENAFIGSMASFIGQKPAYFSVEALEEMQLLELRYHDVMALYEQYAVWQKFGRIIAENLFVRKENREISFLKDNPEERYRKLLAEYPMFVQRVPLQYIASYLGIQPETLSRIRRKV